MKNIVKGYKGIIDLDLSSVPEVYHKEVINQHYKDIKEYKKYQAGLKKEQKYEYTVERVEKILKRNIELERKRLKEEEEKRYERLAKMHYSK